MQRGRRRPATGTDAEKVTLDSSAKGGVARTCFSWRLVVSSLSPYLTMGVSLPTTCLLSPASLLQHSRLSTHFPPTDLLKHEWENDPFKASWVTIRRIFLLCVFIYFSFYLLSLFIAMTSASPLAPPPSPSQTPCSPWNHPFHRLGSALICYFCPSLPPPQ